MQRTWYVLGLGKIACISALTGASLAVTGKDIDGQEAPPDLEGWAGKDTPAGQSSWFDALDSAADEASSTDSASLSWDEDAKPQDRESSSALAEAMGDTEDILDQLIRLGLAIRKSGTNARLRKADSSFRQEEYEPLRNYLRLALLIQRSSSPENQNKTTDERLKVLTARDSGSSSEQDHFISANLRRRHRFVYARQHQRKLEGSLHISIVQDSKLTARTPNIAKTATPSQAASKKLKVVETTRDACATGDPAMTVTTASAVEGDVLKAAAAFSQAASRVSVTTAKLSYPPPPPIPDGVRSFKCPCCCQALPIMFKEKARWRHVCHLPIFSHCFAVNANDKPQKTPGGRPVPLHLPLQQLQ